MRACAQCTSVFGASNRFRSRKKKAKGGSKPRRVILGTGYLYLQSDMKAIWLKVRNDLSSQRQRLTIDSLGGFGTRKVRLVAEVLK